MGMAVSIAQEPITILTPVRFSDPLPDAVDVAVIGGGVIGVFAALYLARMGRRVLVCEKGRIAGEQSSRNLGWIRQMGRDPGELPVMMQALGLWHEVNAETQGQTGVQTHGVTYLARTEAEMARREQWLVTAKSHGVKSMALSKGQVAALFDGQSEGWIGGVHTPDDARGEPWQAVPAVAGLARASGALIREDCAVRALDVTAGRIAGVVTEAGKVRAEQVVLAGGVWSALLARRHGVVLPQLSVRSTVARTAPLAEFFSGNAADGELGLRRRMDGGYTLAITDAHGFYLGPDAFRHFWKFLPLIRGKPSHTDFRLAAPKGFPDGWRTPRKWAADAVSPFERTRVLEPAPDASHVAKMQARFARRFPRIGRPEILNGWAGMIDAMPDVVPVVDRVAALPGLIIATGMSGHGFGIGPGFGRVVARMATGQAAEHDLSRFRFGRFTDGSRLVMGPSI